MVPSLQARGTRGVLLALVVQSFEALLCPTMKMIDFFRLAFGVGYYFYAILLFAVLSVPFFLHFFFNGSCCGTSNV